jgi:hypothetical protein
VVTGLDGCDAFAHRLNDTCTFMSQDYGERAFRILPRECVCVWLKSASMFPGVLQAYLCGTRPCSISVCGLREPLEERPRHLQPIDPCQPPRRRRPSCGKCELRNIKRSCRYLACNCLGTPVSVSLNGAGGTMRLTFPTVSAGMLTEYVCGF